MCPQNSPGNDMKVRRRDEIATAAIEVLATQGFRGLTHRAVDAAAGLKAGSVNYHAPNRGRLLQLAVEELFARDFELAASIFDGLIDTVPLTTDIVVRRIVDFIGAMTSPPADRRVMARHIMLGEAQHIPELRAVFDSQRAAFVEYTQRLVTELDPGHGSETPEMLVVSIEGLVQRQVLIGNPLSRNTVEIMIAGLFR